MIVAGVGCRKGVSKEEVLAAVETALEAHGLAVTALSALATMAFKRDEKAIFAAGRALGLPVIVVDAPAEGLLSSPPLGAEVVSEANRRGGERHDVERRPLRLGPSDLDISPLEGGEERSRSFVVAGVESVSEAAALAVAGDNARLAGPRTIVGPVTCAIAFGGDDA